MEPTSLPPISPVDEKFWAGDFIFVVLADPQFGMLRENESWGEERISLIEAARKTNFEIRATAMQMIEFTFLLGPAPKFSEASLCDRVWRSCTRLS